MTTLDAPHLYGESDVARQTLADIGVEISQYADDLEAITFGCDGTRLAELRTVVHFMDTEMKKTKNAVSS